MIKIIAALGSNFEIGQNGNLPWHLKDDLKYFKDVTMNQTVVMGAKTFKSLDVLVTDNPLDILNMSDDIFIIKKIKKQIKYTNR